MSNYNPYFYQENLKETYKTASTHRDGRGAQDIRHCTKEHSWEGRERVREREREKKGERRSRKGGVCFGDKEKKKKNGYFKFIKIYFLRSNFKFLRPKI
jgi:hypothetical protein